MFENKKIFVLGMARSGYEVCKLLSKYNNKITITDMKEQKKEHVDELETLGVNFILSENPVELLDSSYDCVIKNPGISYNHPLVLKAIELGIKVVNEVEVAYHFLPKDTFIIAVTGSNGKTTTTTLCYEFVKKMGKRVHLAGNIGIPLSGVVSNISSGDVLVIEISAQQLHDLYDFNPNVSILTNLTPVHIDFFENYENYINHKIKIFMNHNENNVAVVNKGNEDSLNNIKNINSNIVYFSSYVDADACIKDNSIFYNNEKIIDIEDIKVKGNHNYENIMCAIIATKCLGISNDVIKDVLKLFGGVEHRIEFVGNFKGVDYYNDSKATNVKSTEIALNAFKTPVILLLGGLDRGHSFEDLSDDLNNVKHIICYGQTKDRICDFASQNGVEFTKFDTLEESTKYACQISEKGDTVLLSPACASWDQYDCFEQRGDEFKKIILNLNNQ